MAYFIPGKLSSSSLLFWEKVTAEVTFIDKKDILVL